MDVMRALHILPVSLLSGALSACGSGPGPTEPTAPPPSFQSYQTTQQALQAAWLGRPVTNAADLPLSGSAVFDGIASFDYVAGSDNGSLKGKITLEADFQRDVLTGSANGFADSQGQNYKGKLQLSDGVLDRAAVAGVDNVLSAQVLGTLHHGGTDLSLTLSFTGDFLGGSFGAIHGYLSGQATTGAGNGLAGGNVIVER